MIDIYHREAQRRKRQHSQVINNLKTELSRMKQDCGELIAERGGRIEAESPTERLMSRMSNIDR